MIIKWLKGILGILALEKENKKLKDEITNHKAYVARKVAELKEYTRVDADIGFRSNNTIVLTGVYRKKAYVRFYDLGDANFIGMVEQLKSMQDHCLIRNVDKPPSFDFGGSFDLF